jgi:tricorn protease
VALIDGRSSSDGDVFAYFFREYGLGPLVGEKTWGGIIGGHGIDLSDGGEVTAADFATTGLNRIPEVENHGVRPDVEVVAAAPAEDPDRDEQLDVAIREGLRSFRPRRGHSFRSVAHP